MAAAASADSGDVRPRRESSASRRWSPGDVDRLQVQVDLGGAARVHDQLVADRLDALLPRRPAAPAPWPAPP